MELKQWFIYFPMGFSENDRYEVIRAFWKFFRESAPGDVLEISDDLCIVGDVYGYIGVFGDKRNSSGEYLDDGGKVITSNLISIKHLAESTAEGGEFVVCTRNHVYRISQSDAEPEFAKKADAYSL